MTREQEVSEQMRVFDGPADLEKAIGTHLGYSGWHTVTQGQVDMFAEATGDHQWIHVDRAKSAAGPFGGTIAHGYLTLSLIPKLGSEVYRVTGFSMGLNYGVDKVRFPWPVVTGTKVRVGVELISLTPARLGQRLVSRMTVECDGSGKPACVADTVSVLVP